VADSLRDPGGTTVALVAGLVAGLVLAGPILPGRDALPGSDVTVGPVGGYLLVGVLAITAIPICITVLYLFFVQVET
jgi:hypothetical protein